MFVGEIGFPRREFLHDIKWWEVKSIIRGYHARHHAGWEQARLVAYNAHTVMGVIRDQSRLFPACVMAGMVAVDDTSGLPELNLVQELAPTESDFAYE